MRWEIPTFDGKMPDLAGKW